MQIKPIFQYRSARRFVVDAIERKKRERRDFSIRKWTKEIGMPSHSLLVMVLAGKRTLTLKQAPLLAEGLGLSTPERMYFQCLIQYENARTDEERELTKLWMSEINPGASSFIREADEFLMIAHWVHMAILALSETKDGCSNADEITARLGGRVPVTEVRSAIERLKSLGILKKEGDRLVCTTTRLTTKDDIANRGAREYYRQVSELAIQAIERVPLDRREFQTFALSMPVAKMALAKEMIRKFRTQFSAAMESEPGDEVFQMNIQLFQLTDSVESSPPGPSKVSH